MLPAARMLMALEAMVGTECVTGSIMPITPQGARSMMQRPVIAAGVAAHVFDAKHKAHVCELENLVIETADFGLLELHAAQFLAAIVADAAR